MDTPQSRLCAYRCGVDVRLGHDFWHQPRIGPFPALRPQAMSLRHATGNMHPSSVTAGCTAPRDIGHPKVPKWQGAGSQAWCAYYLCGAMRKATQVLHQGPASCRNRGSDIRPWIPQQAALGHPRVPGVPCFTHVFISCQVGGHEVSVEP